MPGMLHSLFSGDNQKEFTQSSPPKAKKITATVYLCAKYGEDMNKCSLSSSSRNVNNCHENISKMQ